MLALLSLIALLAVSCLTRDVSMTTPSDHPRTADRSDPILKQPGCQAIYATNQTVNYDRANAYFQVVLVGSFSNFNMSWKTPDGQTIRPNVTPTHVTATRDSFALREADVQYIGTIRRLSVTSAGANLTVRNYKHGGQGMYTMRIQNTCSWLSFTFYIGSTSTGISVGVFIAIVLAALLVTTGGVAVYLVIRNRKRKNQDGGSARSPLSGGNTGYGSTGHVDT